MPSPSEALLFFLVCFVAPNYVQPVLVWYLKKNRYITSAILIQLGVFSYWYLSQK